MAERTQLRNRNGRDPIEQLEQGLQIDEHALDDALVQQPDLYYRVAKQLAMLISRRDAKKQEVAEEEAKADQIYRETALKQKDKTTEAEIKNAIRLDRDVQNVSNELLALNRQVGELTALKEAYQQRSYILKDLVNLYIANYYTSNPDGGASGRWRDHSAQRNREEMNRMRRNERD